MKRFLLGIFAALLSVAASATTFTPIQLLNPAGSSAGQAIVSTGPTTVAAWGGVGVNGIAAIAANTVLANATGSSASPTAFAMPSCTGATNALGYTSGTGIICNSAINAATLGGATFAAPGAIGGTTPGAGTFTTLNSTGNDALTYTNTSGQSLTSGAAAVITGWTKAYDRVNTNFAASTGIFTAPANGFYHVDAVLTLASAALVAGNSFSISVLVNGVTVLQGFFGMQAAATVPISISASGVVQLTAGQTITVTGFQNTGGARTLATTGINNYVSIHKIP